MNFADWLALREPADAAARSTELLERVPLSAPVTVHDLGSGTGSMARWLAPRLPPATSWVLYDRDAELLERARSGVPGAAVRVRDITRLEPADLAGASLVTASALLDMLTGAELDRLVAATVPYPTLLALSVTGQVRLEPADPLDATIRDAFNDHQRRAGRLGPDAATAAVRAYRERGVTVRTRPSPWRLGPERAALVVEWFAGWVGAALEQRPELAAITDSYVQERLGRARTGRLTVLVDHLDVLAGCE
jgi:trans-aconitate methyltransferase